MLQLLALACAGPGPEPVETTKLITDDTSTVGRGVTELEAFYARGIAQRAFDDDGTSVDIPELDTQNVFLTGFRGLTDEVDVSVGAGLSDTLVGGDEDAPDPEGSFAAGVRWRFFETDDGGLSLLWEPGISSPSFARGASPVGVSRDFWSLDNRLVLTRISGRLNASANLVVSLPFLDQDDVLLTTYVADLAVGWQATATIQPLIELNYAYDHVRTAEIDDPQFLGLTVGSTFQITDDVRLDVGGQQAIWGRNREETTSVIVNFGFVL